MFRKTFLISVCTAAAILSMPLSVMAEEEVGMPVPPANTPMTGGPAAGMPMMPGPGGGTPTGPGQPGQMPMMGQPGMMSPEMMAQCHQKMQQHMMSPEMMAQRQEMKQQHMKTMEQHLANIEALLKQLVELQKAK